MLAMTAALLVLALGISNGGSMYPLTSSSCLSVSDGACRGAGRKDGARRLYLMC